jgi:transcriptional regulator with XRE-family HTH domain
MKAKSPATIRKELGGKIRNAREKAKLTQVEVAVIAGIDVNYYARIERGVGNPSYEKLHNIMKALKMDSLSI